MSYFEFQASPHRLIAIHRDASTIPVNALILTRYMLASVHAAEELAKEAHALTGNAWTVIRHPSGLLDVIEAQALACIGGGVISLPELCMYRPGEFVTRDATGEDIDACNGKE